MKIINDSVIFNISHTDTEDKKHYDMNNYGLHINNNLYVTDKKPKSLRTITDVNLSTGQTITIHNSSDTDFWSIGTDPNNTYLHPTQKPLELAERALMNSSKMDDIVLDPFGLIKKQIYKK